MPFCDLYARINWLMFPGWSFAEPLLGWGELHKSTLGLISAPQLPVHPSPKLQCGFDQNELRLARLLSVQVSVQVSILLSVPKFTGSTVTGIATKEEVSNGILKCLLSLGMYCLGFWDYASWICYTGMKWENLDTGSKLIKEDHLCDVWRSHCRLFGRTEWNLLPQLCMCVSVRVCACTQLTELMFLFYLWLFVIKAEGQHAGLLKL